MQQKSAKQLYTLLSGTVNKTQVKKWKPPENLRYYSVGCLE